MVNGLWIDWIKWNLLSLLLVQLHFIQWCISIIQVAQNNNLQFFETSAKTGEGVKEVDMLSYVKYVKFKHVKKLLV